MIEDRELRPGTVLVTRHKGKEHRCEVVAGKEGRVRYRLGDGREFTSPSGAGSAVMGGVACNGWRFWSVSEGADAKPAQASKKTGNRTGKSKRGSRTKIRVHRNGNAPAGGRGGRRA